MVQSVLVVDDKEKLCKIICKNFEDNSYRTFYALDTSKALKILDSHPVDILLLDIRLGNESGITALRQIREKHASLPVIMITAYGTIETAVKCLKIGANDYIQKPIDFPSLLDLVKRTVQLTSVSPGDKKTSVGNFIVTQNKGMLSILEKATCLAATDFPILILGESGTGKELMADFLHAHSAHSSRQIIKINCSAFPESLLENELFGHEKGSFTNANEEYKGVFEQADKGTLFLDEIGDMAPATQAKILRTLQNGEIRRIGGKENIKVQVRFITATNRNLEDLIEQGIFRSDLLYRLNTATINLPPLRKRIEDIKLLADHILQQEIPYNAKSIKGFNDEVINMFIEYDWPGNIRELKNTVLYAAALAKTDIITLEDLPAAFHRLTSPDLPSDCIQEQERRIIQRTLAKTGYNKKQTAELLNISRRTLYNKIEKYQIESG